jgi:very-short-patch-repair endonuclease
MNGGAIASHRSAAYLWGLDIAGDDPVDITVLTRGRRIERAGVAVHRPTDMDDLRPSSRKGIRCANPLRVLIDLGTVAPERVGDAIAQFSIGGLVSPDAAWAVLHRHARKGRPGVVALRSELEDWKFGSRPPDSVLEVEMAKLLSRHGLPAAEFHQRIMGFEVDFRICGTSLIIECDGWAWHGTRREQYERDTERDAILGAAGFIVRRFTWQQIRRRPAWVAEIIRAQLRWATSTSTA